jgi:hypothetical protein
MKPKTAKSTVAPPSGTIIAPWSDLFLVDGPFRRKLQRLSAAELLRVADFLEQQAHRIRRNIRPCVESDPSIRAGSNLPPRERRISTPASRQVDRRCLAHGPSGRAGGGSPQRQDGGPTRVLLDQARVP